MARLILARTLTTRIGQTWHDWRAEMAGCEQQLRGLAAVRLLSHQDFGATGWNVFGYRDGFSQPVVEGSGAEPLPGDGRPIKAGSFKPEKHARPLR
ncbi:hypothetical protein [Actinoplanes subtropicus]|uniref:hypothetical protein n=1 Tax=Actinoplanes subtropicus TaxID=543632 RepID=UPI0004C3E005|nr:hypothetical protein [Actinoplanes subtropicus]